MQFACESCGAIDDHDNSICGICADEVIKHKTMKKANWIFCKDSLPTETGEYIVAMQHKKDKKPFVSAHWFNDTRGGWMSDVADVEPLEDWLEILAWSSLPELPVSLKARGA